MNELDAALALIDDGSHVAFGGRPLTGKPIAFVEALARRGRTGLELTALFGTLDFELLVRAGAVARTTSSYVGLEHLGAAPAHAEAVAGGEIEHRELSEYMIMCGLDAAAAGLPFLPTRAARGTQLAADRELETVTCPYTGEALLAVPALVPDVAVIHAEAADRDGNVAAPELPSFLWDHDRTLARAARSVIVSVERLVEAVDPGRTLLAGFEVDAVVELLGGAAPTGFPDAYAPDWDALAHLSPPR